ncbi:hypothetical protein [Nocardia yamanashiensis]|uniref:hypothetical protein n=1 Tax=Nocardia yamanashiensis TaxID=209247 RepID=UPI0038CD46C5
MQGNSGYILTVAEINREIAEREREIEAVAATLVELDKHPGLLLLRRFPPTGKTAVHWAPAQRNLDLLWEDFGRLRTILDQVRTARARRRLDALDREELTALLRGRPLEVSRDAIPLSRRSLTGPSHQITRVGFADTLDRMRALFPTLIEILDAVDTVNTRVLAEITPLQTQLAKIGATRTARPPARSAGLAEGAGTSDGRRSADRMWEAAGHPASADPPRNTSVGPDAAGPPDNAGGGASARFDAAGFPELRELAHDLAELATRAATDPLSLPPAEIDRRLADLRGRMHSAATLIAELDAIAAQWDDAVERMRGRIEALHRTYERADQARGAAERTIATAALPVRGDDSAMFGAELTALEAGSPDPAALWELGRRLAEAQAAATRNEELAQGLLDRRQELSGRLAAYRAKAARLGVSEDREVLAASSNAAGLLSRRPCDLGAVTRAVSDYRQLIAMKSGRGL